MDITTFINSPDIREHIKNIRYQFTSIEAAWLIWQCRHITLAERHEAWRELIRSMPDERIKKRRWTREWPSLHAYLEKRIAFEEKLLSAFNQTTSQTFYMCEIWVPGQKHWEESL